MSGCLMQNLTPVESLSVLCRMWRAALGLTVAWAASQPLTTASWPASSGTRHCTVTAITPR